MQAVEKTTATHTLTPGGRLLRSQRLIPNTEITHRAAFKGTLKRDGETKPEANDSKLRSDRWVLVAEPEVCHPHTRPLL
jgi:hypothetical protein